MLGMLFKALKKKNSLEDQVLAIQQGDHTAKEELIEQYKPFIAKTVSSVCRRYINESDDEFSIGLIAFNEAIEKYSPTKGRSLLTFSEIVIKRRVVDYIRKQMKNEMVSYENIHSDHHEDNLIDHSKALLEFQKENEQRALQEEILYYQSLLKEFRLTFKDLTENCPKHKDARINAIKVAQCLANDPELRDSFLEKRRLPMNQLEKKVEVSRKTIERNRKYIIAVTIILVHDFLYIKDYLKGVVED